MPVAASAVYGYARGNVGRYPSSGRAGDVLSLVYEKLRKVEPVWIAKDELGQNLQPTALVHCPASRVALRMDRSLPSGRLAMTELSLFIEALEIADAAERITCLDRACTGNAALRTRAERLRDRCQRDLMPASMLVADVVEGRECRQVNHLGNQLLGEIAELRVRGHSSDVLVERLKVAHTAAHRKFRTIPKTWLVEVPA